MSTKRSLGVEPYQGKVLEDQGPEPLDATLKTDPWAVSVAIPTPEQWVGIVVRRAMSTMDSMRFHPLVDCGEPVRRAAVLGRWLLNQEQALFTQADCDVVLEALQRGPSDPVDPSETPAVITMRNYALEAARGRVLLRRTQLS